MGTWAKRVKVTGVVLAASIGRWWKSWRSERDNLSATELSRPNLWDAIRAVQLRWWKLTILFERPWNYYNTETQHKNLLEEFENPKESRVQKISERWVIMGQTTMAFSWQIDGLDKEEFTELDYVEINKGNALLPKNKRGW